MACWCIWQCQFCSKVVITWLVGRMWLCTWGVSIVAYGIGGPIFICVCVHSSIASYMVGCPKHALAHGDLPARPPTRPQLGFPWVRPSTTTRLTEPQISRISRNSTRFSTRPARRVDLYFMFVTTVCRTDEPTHTHENKRLLRPLAQRGARPI